MTRITMHRLFQAPADIVWEVMTDPNVYEEVAPNLSSVVILDGEGVGMVRECVDTNGNAWTESCYRWEDGQGFAVAVDVETSDFHRPLFTRFEGEWSLTERDDEVLVTMQLDFETKYGSLGSLLGRYIKYKAAPMTEAIFDGWDAEIDTRLAKSESDPSTAEGDATSRERHTNQLYR